jgi:replication initiation and membrane attachment protein DnaB
MFCQLALLIWQYAGFQLPQEEKRLLEQLAEQYKIKWQETLDSFHKLEKLQKDSVAMLKVRRPLACTKQHAGSLHL